MAPHPATAAPALSLSACRVVLGGRPIVRDVDLHLRAGEVVGMFGPSGAGKSTLFGAISGEVPMAGGTVCLDRRDLGGLPMWQRARRGLGYVPQGPSVLFDLTVRENLRTFASLAGVTIDIEERAAEVALRDRLDLRAGALSGGERRRLELARALLGAPRVLLCDEPFAGLGPASAQAIADLLLARARTGGLAVLLSDHHVGLALSISDRAYLLVDGAIEAQGDAISFARDAVVSRAYVGAPEKREEKSAEPRTFP